MPMEEKVYELLITIAKDYNRLKEPSKDSDKKKEQMRAVKKLLRTTKENSDTDAAWIKVILQLGEEAYNTQLLGNVHSRYADALIRMTHIILQQIETKVLQPVILEKMRFFDDKLNEYYESIENSSPKQKIEELEKSLFERMCELLYLGATHLLLELPSDEIQEFFPSAPKLDKLSALIPDFMKSTAEGVFSYIGKKTGYIKNEKRFLYRSDCNMGDANPNLPLMAQPYAFEQFYLETYDPEQRRFFSSPKPVEFPAPIVKAAPEIKPNHTQPVSSQLFEKLIDDIKMYKSISGNTERITQSNDMKERLEDLMHRTKTAFKLIEPHLTDKKELNKILKIEADLANEWFDILSDIGKMAYDMQMAGSYKIVGIPIVSCAKGSEIFHKMVQDLREELKNNVPGHFDLRLHSEKHLLEIKRINALNKKAKSIETDSCKEIEKDVMLQRRNLANFGDLRAIIFLRQSQLKKMYDGEHGDEWTGPVREKVTGTKVGGYKWSHTAGTEGKGCIYLPDVLRQDYRDRFKQTWAPIIKTFQQKKIATADAKTEIAALTKKLALFTQQEVTADDISAMKKTIEKINKLIDLSLEKVELHQSLSEQIEEFNKIDAALEIKQEALRQAEQTVQLQKEEAEKKAGISAIENIAVLNEITTRLLETSRLLKTKSLEELKTKDSTSAFFTEVSVIQDAYIVPIERAIQEAPTAQRDGLMQELSKAREPLNALMATSADIEKMLAKNDASLLPSPQKDESDLNLASPVTPKTPTSTNFVMSALSITPSAMQKRLETDPAKSEQVPKKKKKKGKKANKPGSGADLEVDISYDSSDATPPRLSPG